MPWTPADLISPGNTGAWFDLADLSTLFQLSSGSTPITADAQPIGRINAKYGAGAKAFDLTQATSGSKPTYKTDGSKHWAQFDGADWLDSLVSRFGNTGLFVNGSESFTIAIACDLGVNTGTLIARASSDGATKTDQIYYTSTNDLRIISRGSVAYGHSIPAAGPAVIAQRWNGATNQLRYNDSIQTANVGAAAEEAAQRIIVGARTNGTGHYLGNGSKVYQLFFIDRALTDNEWGYLTKYFGDSAGRTGIGLDPPVGEPSLIVSGVQTAQAATSPTLTQANLAQPINVSQSQTVEAVAISQSGGLAPVGVTQAQAIGSPSITQAHAMAISGVVQAQEMQPAALSFGASLSTEVVTQSQNITVIGITAAYTVAPGIMSQEASISLPALAGSYFMQPSDATQTVVISGGVIFLAEFVPPSFRTLVVGRQNRRIEAISERRVLIVESSDRRLVA